MICLNFRVVGTKFSEGDRLPRLTGCPLCCAVAYFSKHALLLRFHSGCNALIYIEYQWRLHIWNVGQAVFGLYYGGIAFRLCGWHLSISSGPYAQVLQNSIHSFNILGRVQITCYATLQQVLSPDTWRFYWTLVLRTRTPAAGLSYISGVVQLYCHRRRLIYIYCRRLLKLRPWAPLKLRPRVRHHGFRG